jgi:hypothetical protein
MVEAGGVVEALIAEWDKAPASDRTAPCHSSMSAMPGNRLHTEEPLRAAMGHKRRRETVGSGPDQLQHRTSEVHRSTNLQGLPEAGLTRSAAYCSRASRQKWQQDFRDVKQEPAWSAAAYVLEIHKFDYEGHAARPRHSVFSQGRQSFS